MAAKTTTRKKTTKAKSESEEKDVAASYNRYKMYDGKQYTGMQIGRSHKWKYDAGEWHDTKITPDLWHISYAVTKRRAGRAPKDSGARIGTGYHWFIVAHQNVHKLNANDYSTAMSGLKFKIAHKRADKDQWSAKAAGQRKRLISFLKEFIAQLEQEPVPILFEYDGKTYKGEGIPIMHTCEDGICKELDITLNDAHLGIVRRLKAGWKTDDPADPKLIKALGKYLDDWYKR